MNRMKLIDAHTHVHFRVYDVDRNDVIARALGVGIGMVNVGTDKKTSAEAVALVEKYEGCWATVGLHPIHTAPSFHDEDEGADAPEMEFDYGYYLKLAKHPKVVAIGECGFDYFHLPSDVGHSVGTQYPEDAKTLQKEAFLAQIKLAHEVRKPLMLHCRSAESSLSEIERPHNAYRDLIDTLKAQNSQLKASAPGISHFFSGTLEEARELLEMGFYFTFGGAITLPKKPNGADFEALVKLVPLDRILIETDAPYVAPLKYRGRRNEPSYVEEVVVKLAEFRSISVSEMERITLENTKTIFPNL